MSNQNIIGTFISFRFLHIKMRIIIADDSETFRKLLVGVIRKISEDLEIDEVSDGIDLIQKVKENNYDLAITDNTMIKMDGLVAIERIRLFDKELPIYVVSGAFYIEKKVLEAGATGFIDKYNIDKLEHKLRNVISPHSDTNSYQNL